MVGNVGSALQTKISPNPCRGVATVTLPQVATTVTITNMAGKTVYETTGTGRRTVALREQPVGLYMVRIANETGYVVHKLIVQ